MLDRGLKFVTTDPNFHEWLKCLFWNLWKCPQVENEAVEEETKEESDEEDEEDEESGRIRFKSERKDGVVVRLADAGSKSRNIPETLGTNFSFIQ